MWMTPTVSLIKELRDEQRRLLAPVDHLADDVAKLSVNKKNKSKSLQASVIVQRMQEKAYMLETQEVWRQSKLLYPTMLL